MGSNKNTDIKCIRICHIASGDLWAGAEVQAFNIIDGLKKLNQCKVIAIIMNKGKLYNELLKIGIDVYLVDETKHNFIRQIVMIRKIIARNKIEIINSHRYKENIIASIVKVSLGDKVKLIKTQHGTFNLINKISTYQYRSIVYRTMDKFCTKYLFDKVIAVSNDISNPFKKFIPESNIITISNSICFERYNVSYNRNFLPFSKERCLKMAIIGRLVKIKNIDEFITITTELNRNGLQVKSYVVGDGPEKEHLTNLTDKRGSTGYINFLGNIENISEVYNEIDILFITSIHEGVPTVLLEAMFFGKIVIARNIGGIPEVIVNDVNGFLYDDIEQAKKIVRMIYNNSSKYNYISNNARKIVRERHSIIVQSQKYSDVYQLALN